MSTKSDNLTTKTIVNLNVKGDINNVQPLVSAIDLFGIINSGKDVITADTKLNRSEIVDEKEDGEISDDDVEIISEKEIAPRLLNVHDLKSQHTACFKLKSKYRGYRRSSRYNVDEDDYMQMVQKYKELQSKLVSIQKSTKNDFRASKHYDLQNSTLQSKPMIHSNESGKIYWKPLYQNIAKDMSSNEVMHLDSVEDEIKTLRQLVLNSFSNKTSTIADVNTDNSDQLISNQSKEKHSLVANIKSTDPKEVMNKSYSSHSQNHNLNDSDIDHLLESCIEGNKIYSTLIKPNDKIYSKLKTSLNCERNIFNALKPTLVNRYERNLNSNLFSINTPLNKIKTKKNVNLKKSKLDCNKLNRALIDDLNDMNIGLEKNLNDMDNSVVNKSKDFFDAERFVEKKTNTSKTQKYAKKINSKNNGPVEVINIIKTKYNINSSDVLTKKNDLNPNKVVNVNKPMPLSNFESNSNLATPNLYFLPGFPFNNPPPNLNYPPPRIIFQHHSISNALPFFNFPNINMPYVKYPVAPINYQLPLPPQIGLQRPVSNSYCFDNNNQTRFTTLLNQIQLNMNNFDTNKKDNVTSTNFTVNKVKLSTNVSPLTISLSNQISYSTSEIIKSSENYETSNVGMLINSPIKSSHYNLHKTMNMNYIDSNINLLRRTSQESSELDLNDMIVIDEINDNLYTKEVFDNVSLEQDLDKISNESKFNAETQEDFINTNTCIDEANNDKSEFFNKICQIKPFLDSSLPDKNYSRKIKHVKKQSKKLIDKSMNNKETSAKVPMIFDKFEHLFNNKINYGSSGEETPEELEKNLRERCLKSLAEKQNSPKKIIENENKQLSDQLLNYKPQLKNFYSNKLIQDENELNQSNLKNLTRFGNKWTSPKFKKFSNKCGKQKILDNTNLNKSNMHISKNYLKSDNDNAKNDPLHQKKGNILVRKNEILINNNQEQIFEKIDKSYISKTNISQELINFNISKRCLNSQDSDVLKTSLKTNMNYEIEMNKAISDHTCNDLLLSVDDLLKEGMEKSRSKLDLKKKLNKELNEKYNSIENDKVTCDYTNFYNDIRIINLNKKYKNKLNKDNTNKTDLRSLMTRNSEAKMLGHNSSSYNDTQDIITLNNVTSNVITRKPSVITFTNIPKVHTEVIQHNLSNLNEQMMGCQFINIVPLDDNDDIMATSPNNMPYTNNLINLNESNTYTQNTTYLNNKTNKSSDLLTTNVQFNKPRIIEKNKKKFDNDCQIFDTVFKQANNKGMTQKSNIRNNNDIPKKCISESNISLNILKSKATSNSPNFNNMSLINCVDHLKIHNAIPENTLVNNPHKKTSNENIVTIPNINIVHDLDDVISPKTNDKYNIRVVEKKLKEQLIKDSKKFEMHLLRKKLNQLKKLISLDTKKVKDEKKDLQQTLLALARKRGQQRQAEIRLQRLMDQIQITNNIIKMNQKEIVKLNKKSSESRKLLCNKMKTINAMNREVKLTANQIKEFLANNTPQLNERSSENDLNLLKESEMRLMLINKIYHKLQTTSSTISTAPSNLSKNHRQRHCVLTSWLETYDQLAEYQILNLFQPREKLTRLPSENFDNDSTNSDITSCKLLDFRHEYSSFLTHFKFYSLLKDDKENNFSPTYFNKIDFKKPFCYFELQGNCSDEYCKWQHAKDYLMTDKDVRTNLLSVLDNNFHSKLIGEALNILKFQKGEEDHREKCQSFLEIIRSNLNSDDVLNVLCRKKDSIIESLEYNLANCTFKNACNAEEVPIEKLQRFWMPTLQSQLTNLQAAVTNNPHDIDSYMNLASLKMNVAASRGLDNAIDQALHVLSRALEVNRTDRNLWQKYLTLYSSKFKSSDSFDKNQLADCRNSFDTAAVDNMKIIVERSAKMQFAVVDENHKLGKRKYSTEIKSQSTLKYINPNISSNALTCNESSNVKNVNPIYNNNNNNMTVDSSLSSSHNNTIENIMYSNCNNIETNLTKKKKVPTATLR